MCRMRESSQDAVKTHHDTRPELYGRIVAAANHIDHDTDNADEYIYQLGSEYPIQDIDMLKDSIQTILSDNTDGS